MEEHALSEQGPESLSRIGTRTLAERNRRGDVRLQRPSSSFAFPCAVRFSTANTLQVLDGSSYRGDLSYSPNRALSHPHARLDRIALYDVYVTPKVASKNRSPLDACSARASGRHPVQQLGAVVEVAAGEIVVSNVTTNAAGQSGSTTLWF